MNTAGLFLTILFAGLASQWVAWRFQLPAIVVLITTGLVFGPVTGLINLSLPPSDIAELIGLGVAIILFEGGMDLKLAEFRRVGKGIQRLTLLGPPIAWVLGSAAAHYIAGLSWAVSWVLGAILVVTGPTVIMPLLRQVRLNKESASLLKWEGIVNDPIGVLLAVLTFQYFTIAGSDMTQTATAFGLAISVTIFLGGGGGWLTGWVFQRGLVPEHLKPPLLLVLVLLVYSASNLVQHEAGLLSVTAMGLVIGNMKLVEREDLMRFKENLTVILLSVLFIIIPSQLDRHLLKLLDFRMVLFVVVVLVVVRPITIFMATLGAPIRMADRKLLAWIAPRGIVAAATAGIFGPALINAGYFDGEKLLLIVFLVIMATVLAHGFTIGRFSRYLGLASKRANGLLIVGASPWTTALAKALEKHEVEVLLVDGAYHRLKDARMANLDIYYGEILSEHAEHTLETLHLNHLLCATENDFYNALVCKTMGRSFGHHRSFQLATHQETRQEPRRLSIQRRGHLAFNTKANYQILNQLLEEGWKVQSSVLRKNYSFEQMKQRLGKPGDDWLVLGGITPDGNFRLYSTEQSFIAVTGWTIFYFAPENKREEKEIITEAATNIAPTP